MDEKSGPLDARYSELDSWCTERLTELMVSDKQSGLKSVSGDASFRRYYRAHTNSGDSFIAVNAPPPQENCGTFVAIAKSWREQGIRTPVVHFADIGRGYMLLEDFGDQLFYSALEPFQTKERLPDSIDNLYDSAIDALLVLQKSRAPKDYSLPVYDGEWLTREMQLFPEWCLTQLLGMALTDDEHTLLTDLFAKLTKSALAQPQVPVHRDYHSRNIMMLSDGLGLIDFQDAVLGPVTYDPVSLLRDCYLDWPQKKVYQWLDHFAARSEHLQGVDKDQLYQWFDWMGAQRHIKVLGLFVRLWLRDGKSVYLNDIPRVTAYLGWVCARYPELSEACYWLNSEVLPRLKAQNWWQDYSLRD